MAMSCVAERRAAVTRIVQKLMPSQPVNVTCGFVSIQKAMAANMTEMASSSLIIQSRLWPSMSTSGDHSTLNDQGENARLAKPVSVLEWPACFR